MSYLSLLYWADEDVPLLELCARQDFFLPSIIQVKTGFYGMDDYKIGSEEMFFMYDFRHQRRVLAMSDKGKMFSFPIDCKVKFQMCKDGNKRKTSNKMLLQSAVNEWKLNINQKWIMVEGNKAVTYKKDVCDEEVGSLGVLQLQEVFDLKYVLAHAMCADIGIRTIAIPDFVDITVSRAIGAAYADQLVYRNWFDKLSSFVSTFNHDDFNMNEDIIYFNDYSPQNKSSSHYGYIHQNAPPKINGTKDPKTSDKYEGLSTSGDVEENIYDKIEDLSLSFHFDERKVTRDFPLSLPSNKIEPIKQDSLKNKKVPPLPVNQLLPVRKAKVPTPVSDVEEQYCTDGEGGDDDEDEDDEDEYKEVVIVKGNNFVRESNVGGVRVKNMVKIVDGNITLTTTCVKEKNKINVPIRIPAKLPLDKISTKPRMPSPRRKN